MINIKKDSIVYIFCPAYSKTGGPELLHQLAHNLKEKGIHAPIIYINTSSDNENYTPDDFKIYNFDFGFENDIIDDKNNIVIIPEIYVERINKYKRIRTAIWWLSVDNYSKNYTYRKSMEVYGFKHTLKLLLNGKILFHGRDYKKADYHLCQSYYSINFLKQNGISSVEYLSDYINDSYLKIDNLDKTKRENIVLYNPKKGIEFTKKIMNKASDIDFIAIQNLTTEQVKELLLKSKVYIDFGNHPGKDRFPREAAMCGCCVITGKKGSAYFYEDVPIDDEFKFKDDENNIDSIVKQIKKCLKEYDTQSKKFAGYRKFISDEKNKFKDDINHIFIIDK